MIVQDIPTDISDEDLDTHIQGQEQTVGSPPSPVLAKKRPVRERTHPMRYKDYELYG